MLPYDEHTVIEPPDEETDAYMILMRDSKGEWVTVSPGGCGEPSLNMGFQFMNDIGWLLMMKQRTNHECAKRCIIHKLQRMVVFTQ